YLLGRIAYKTGDYGRAQPRLEDAFWIGQSVGNDELAARAASRLAWTVGRRETPVRGHAWTRHAEALVRRMGGHAQLEAQLEDHRANLLEWQGRFAEGVDHSRRAIELAERAFGPRSLEVTEMRSNLAVLLRGRGMLRESVRL